MSLFNNLMNKGKQLAKDKGAKIDVTIHGPAIPQHASIGINVPNPQISPGKIDLNIKGPTNPEKPKIGVDIHGPKINAGKIDIKGPNIDIKGPNINITQNMQNYKIPESAHAHPLILDEHLYAECKICRINIGGQAGYRCGACDVTLCFNCSNRIFYGNKQQSAHPQHPLTLTSRKSKWKCDLCKQSFTGGASFYCKQCDFDACDRCYLREGYPEGFLPPQPGYMFQLNTGYPPQSGYPMGNPPQPGYSSQPQFPPPSGFPPQPEQGYQFNPAPNFPPQPGYPPQNTNFSHQQDSETIRSLNETIKSYELKIKNLETENINLRKSNMDERNQLQATIDALQKQLETKEGIIKNLETEKNSFFHKSQQFEGDINRIRIDLTNITKERDRIVMEKNEEVKKLGFTIDDLTKKSSYFEAQFKAKENELGQINGRMMEERKQMQFQIDSLNNQLIVSQNQLKDFEYLQITIKKYEEFLNKLKFDITQFQSSTASITITKIHK